ncbi:glucose-1-phosphate thymidylyltransferase [Actinosynnema sp. CS-041913]|uniref:glucose-1-phosphate thymidylyltransferase n=1 Tax=Actinosynnema sp. CS-041913 TaxID=3239917 RepID=UPI003D90A0C8
MKALILAGGIGTRLRPLTYSTPKQLVPVANKPVLEYVIEDVRKLGVTGIGLVVGDHEAEIAAAIGDGSRFRTPITYLRQHAPLGLAHCVRLARPFLGDDDFVMYLGDNLLPDGCAEVAEEFRVRRPAAQLVVQRVADPRAFGVVELDGANGVRRVVEKPERPPSDLAMMGVYFFTKAIHEAVAAITPGKRGELEITDAVQWLISHGAAVTASEYKGYWRDAGRVEDILECNRELLGRLRRRIAGEVDAASEVVGQVVIEPGARVVGSRIEGPAIVGARTLVENTRLGPYASVGRDCVLRGAGVDDSIVLDGAAISGIAGIRDSLIGRSAVVGARVRRTAGRARQRLVVGDHTHLELAVPGRGTVEPVPPSQSKDGQMTAIPQGDLRLLDTDVAQRLLHSKEMARVAYVAGDGTPRVVTVMFNWNGSEFVFSSFRGAYKIKDLQARPDVAVTIDRNAFPPEILLLRGKVEMTEIEGVTGDFAAANYRYGGQEFGGSRLSEVDHPGVQMVRIALKPTWVGMLDFRTRFPRGRDADQFSLRGRD